MASETLTPEEWERLRYLQNLALHLQVKPDMVAQTVIDRITTAEEKVARLERLLKTFEPFDEDAHGAA